MSGNNKDSEQIKLPDELLKEQKDFTAANYWVDVEDSSAEEYFVDIEGHSKPAESSEGYNILTWVVGGMIAGATALVWAVSRVYQISQKKFSDISKTIAYNKRKADEQAQEHQNDIDDRLDDFANDMYEANDQVRKEVASLRADLDLWEETAPLCVARLTNVERNVDGILARQAARNAAPEDDQQLNDTGPYEARRELNFNDLNGLDQVAVGTSDSEHDDDYSDEEVSPEELVVYSVPGSTIAKRAHNRREKQEEEPFIATTPHPRKCKQLTGEDAYDSDDGCY